MVQKLFPIPARPSRLSTVPPHLAQLYEAAEALDRCLRAGVRDPRRADKAELDRCQAAVDAARQGAEHDHSAAGLRAQGWLLGKMADWLELAEKAGYRP